MSDPILYTLPGTYAMRVSPLWAVKVLQVLHPAHEINNNKKRYAGCRSSSDRRYTALSPTDADPANQNIQHWSNKIGEGEGKARGFLMIQRRYGSERVWGIQRKISTRFRHHFVTTTVLTTLKSHTPNAPIYIHLCCIAHKKRLILGTNPRLEAPLPLFFFW